MMFLRVLASVLKIFRGKVLNGCITAVTVITLFINGAIAFEEAKPTLLDNPISEADLLTKQILLKGIEINRFNLLYRLEAGVAPKHRHTRYFMAQETSALGNLTAAVHIWTVCQIYSWRKKSEGGRSEPELFKPICDDDCNLRKYQYVASKHYFSSRLFISLPRFGFGDDIVCQLLRKRIYLLQFFQNR